MMTYMQKSIACAESTDTTSCAARAGSDKCGWERIANYCFYTPGPFSDLDLSKCSSASTDISCKYILDVVAIVRACQALTSQSACSIDANCAWMGTAGCDTSDLPLLVLMQKLGGALSSELLTQERLCNKLASKEACLAELLPGASASPGGSRSTTGTSSTGSSKSGAGAALPTLLAAGLALLALAAF